jgi:hypothetical protein
MLSWVMLLGVKAMQKDFISGFSSLASFNIIPVPKFEFGWKQNSSSVIAKKLQNCNKNNHETRYTR